MTLPRESSNVSLEEEMVTLIVAQRLYEVNLKALKAATDMEKSLVDLLQ